MTSQWVLPGSVPLPHDSLPVWVFERVVGRRLEDPVREAGRSPSRAKRAVMPAYYHGRMTP